MSTHFFSDVNLIRQAIREELQNIYNTPMNQFVYGVDVAGPPEEAISATMTTTGGDTSDPLVWMNPNTFTVQPYTPTIIEQQPTPVVFGPVTYQRHTRDFDVINVPEECELLLHATRLGHDLTFTFKGPTVEQAAGSLGEEELHETLLRLDREFKLAVIRAFKLVPVAEVKRTRMLILED